MNPDPPSPTPAHPPGSWRQVVAVDAAGQAWTWLDVLDRDRWRCQLCQRPIDRARRFPDLASPSVDHVAGRWPGLIDRPEDLQAAHLGCNLAKGDPTRPAEPACRWCNDRRCILGPGYALVACPECAGGAWWPPFPAPLGPGPVLEPEVELFPRPCGHLGAGYVPPTRTRAAGGG